MAGYSIRSLDELSRQARGFFTGAIEGAIASVWANTFTVFGKVLAACGFEQELRRKWLFAQIFASTADEVWLARHAFELGLKRYTALPALGSATWPAAPGTVVPAGLQLTRADGVTFTTLKDASADGNSVTLTLQADEPGSLGNTDAGTLLTFVDAVDLPDGITGAGLVDADGLGGGADPEKLEAFRARVLSRKRKPPQGGSAPDYETWVREALGAVVDRVYVASFANETRSVWVAFTVTDQPNGIPTPAQVTIAQAAINDPVRRPLCARAYAIRLQALPIPVQIKALRPDNTDTRISVETELAATFADLAEPGLPSGDTTLSKSWLTEAVSRAVGEGRHRMPLPLDDITVPAGYLPVLGPVTYTD